MENDVSHWPENGGVLKEVWRDRGYITGFLKNIFIFPQKNYCTPSGNYENSRVRMGAEVKTCSCFKTLLSSVPQSFKSVQVCTGKTPSHNLVAVMPPKRKYAEVLSGDAQHRVVISIDLGESSVCKI